MEATHALREITNKPVSDQTVRNYLKKVGMKAVVKKKKPKLIAKQKRDRSEFAIRHQHWTIDDWMHAIWSDENKINRIGSDGRQWIWKFKGEGITSKEVQETLKFRGGNCMIWGCMTWEGTGNMCKIDGTMDKELYVQILEEDLKQTLQGINKNPADIIFQQDNDPKNTSKLARKWFEDNGFKVMEWPAQSVDLNPIEHLWKYIKDRLGEYTEPPKGILILGKESRWSGARFLRRYVGI